MHGKETQVIQFVLPELNVSWLKPQLVFSEFVFIVLCKTKYFPHLEFEPVCNIQPFLKNEFYWCSKRPSWKLEFSVVLALFYWMISLMFQHAFFCHSLTLCWLILVTRYIFSKSLLLAIKIRIADKWLAVLYSKPEGTYCKMILRLTFFFQLWCQ